MIDSPDKKRHDYHIIQQSFRTVRFKNTLLWRLSMTLRRCMFILIVGILVLYGAGLLGYAIAAPSVVLSPVAFVVDGADGFEELAGPKGITVATIGSSTYALVSAYNDNGVQIIDITDPFNPSPVAAMTDGEDGFEWLADARHITTAAIGPSTYAFVSSSDNGVQIIDITTPSSPTPVASISSALGTLFADPRDLVIFAIGPSTYAIVAGNTADIQIINITDPFNPSLAAAMTNGEDGFDGVRGLDTTVIGSSTYGLVAEYRGNAFRIINITDPSHPSPVATVHDSQDVKLDGATAVTAVTIGSSTYALVAAQHDDAIQIINITDPSNPSPVAFAQDGIGGFDRLEYPEAVTTVTIGSSTYAFVAAFLDGIQIIDITDPSNPTPAASVANFDPRFGGVSLPEDIAVTTIDSKIYVVAASYAGNSVPIINVAFVSGPLLTSASLDEGTGILSVEFSSAVDVTPVSMVDLSGLVIRDSGQSITLTGATLNTVADSAVISIEMTENQRRSVATMASPLLDISGAAVTDTSGDPIESTSGNAITVTDDVAPSVLSPFITTWQTTAAGESITIPVGDASGAYTVDWGDGTASVGVTGKQTHTYDDAGTYTVSMSGDFTKIVLSGDSTNASKLQSIEQWGDIRWDSMSRAFHGASNMIYNATDAPNLSGVTDMHGMFRGAFSFNGDISDWNVSSVTSMGRMFFDATSFNQRLDSWNVSSVTKMNGMFAGATSFNGDISDWNVSSVTDMYDMFWFASSFNQPLDSWDVSSVTNMHDMFAATSFNQPLNSWNVSSVTDMHSMFADAASFNQPLNSWDVSSVIRMDYMFASVTAFDQPLNSWDVSSVTKMDSMFSGATSFNQPLNSWNVSSVTKMNGMFAGATSFNGDISDWNVSSVTDMYDMFWFASSFNQPLDSWDVSSVTDMYGMFWFASSFNQNLGKWYIVLDNMTIDYDDAPGIVGSVSAQNSFLDGQNPVYGIGLGGDSDSFELNGYSLVLKTVPAMRTYTVNVTSAGDFGTGNSKMIEITVAGFNTSPTLESIQRYTPATENTDNQTLVYKATFSENVTGVDVSDFILSPDSAGGTGGGSSPVTDVSGSGDVYSVTVFASTNGTYNLDLVSSGHDIADTASNSLTNTSTTGADETYTVSTAVIDDTAPTLESIQRYTPATENTDNQTLVYKATFSEDVTGVTVSDFTLSSDSAGGESTSTSTGQFTQTRSPHLTIPDLATVSDTITVSSSGTVASVSVEVDITHNYIGDLKIDIIAPDGTSITLHDNSGGSTVNIDQPYAPLFGSIPISGVWTLQIHDNYDADPGVLNSWTLTINYGDTATTVSSVTDISGSGDVYYVTVSATQDGTYNLDLISSGHGIADTASNPLTNTSTTGADETYTVSTAVIDNTNPRLESIERSSPTSQNTDSQSLLYKATFSEDVMGVTASDFVLSPSSTGRVSGTTQVTGISGSGDTYYVTVSSTVDGTYNLDLISSGHNIADASSNPLTNTAPTGADQTYIVSTTVTDTANPRLESIERYNPASQNTDSQSLVYKATFSESVTGVNTSDFVLSPDSTGGEDTTSTGQFTQTRSPNLAIPYDATVSDTITVPDSETATSVSVAIDITHTYIGDLKIDLIAPDGTTKTLHNYSDGGEDDIDQTYAPSFGSIPISGVWTLQIHDNYYADSGVLNSWTLTINYTTTTTTTTVNPVTAISGSGDTYYVTVSSTVDGTYNLDLVSSDHNIVDAANNSLTNTATTGADQTYTVSTAVIDNTNPRLASIERYTPATENTDNQTLVYKATFSEDVTGVTVSDFTLSSDSAGGESTSTSTGQFTQTRSPHLTIPDLATVSDIITVSSSGTVASVSVEVDITHNYIGDLKIDIIAPDGTSITLHDNSGGSTVNIDQPYAPLFGSIPISGVWTLQIHDNYDADPGVLNSWTLTINYSTTTTVSPVTGISGSGDVYYVTVSATQDGTYNLDLVSSDHNIVDAANNSLTNTATTGADQTYTVSTAVIDNTNPRLASIERSSPTSQNTDSLSLLYKATFSEDVMGVTASDFVLSPSSTGRVSGTTQVTGISGSGDVYYVTVFASTNGTYNLDLVSSDHNIVDAANNSLTNTATTGADQTYTVSTAVIDNTNPRLASIERYTPATENTDNQTLVYKATFSEDVTGVTVSDFTLSSDSAGGESTSTSTGQFTHTRSPNLTIPDLATVSDTITVPDSETATSVSVEVDITHNYIGDLKIDIIAPDGTSITLHDNSGGSTDNIDQPYAPSFGSIPISGVWTLQIHDNYDADPGVLNSWTLTINYGDTATTVSSVTDISGSGDVYYVTVSATQDGTYNLDLVSSGHDIADTASNSLTNTSTTGADETYTVSTAVIDDTAPTLESIQRYTPATENTDNQTLVYKATFSESVTGVTASDFVLSPGSTGGINGVNPVTAISGSGDTYYVTVSSTVDGTYNLDLVSSGHNIADASSNPLTNTAPTGADQTYIVSTTVTDTANPRLESIERYNPASQNTDSQSLVYKATFSESVTGVNTSDFVLSPDSTGGGNSGNSQVTAISSSGSVYYVTVSAAQDGTYNLDLVSSGHGIEDTADNPLINTVPATGTDETYTVSTTVTNITAPTLFSIERYNQLSATTSSRTLIYEVTFSENVTGVYKAVFVLSPGSTGGTGNDSDHIVYVSGSGSVYNVIVIALADGTYNLDLVSSGHGIVDTDNNPLTYTAPTTGIDETYIYSTAN